MSNFEQLPTSSETFTPPTVTKVRFGKQDVETVADVQHAIWSHWMRYLFSQCLEEEDGCMTIPSAFVERWQRQCATDYADLSEREKDSDRNQAWKVLNALFGQPVAQIARQGEEIAALREELESAREAIQTLNAVNADMMENNTFAERLREFAEWAIRIAWRGEDIDGGDLQKKAAELGLLKPAERVTPCHPDCQCAEVHGWGAEITCYRFTEMLEPAADPNEGTTIKNGLDEIREKFGRYFSD